MYGETLLSGQASGDAGSYAASEASDHVNGRATRASRASNGNSGTNGSRKRKHIETYGSDDDLSDEDSAQESEDHWDGGDDFEDEKDNGVDSADDDDMSVEEEDDPIDSSPRSLIVKLKVGKRISDGADSAVVALNPTSTVKKESSTPVAEGQDSAHPALAPSQELSKPEPMEIETAPAPPAHPIAFELAEDEKTNAPLPGQEHFAHVHGHPPFIPESAHHAHKVAAPQQAQVQANGWN